MTIFTQTVIEIIKNIPRGKVMTYGQIARLAGSPRAARQVVFTLTTASRKEDLPWHRVMNKRGKISLTEEGYRLQKELLMSEGVEFDLYDVVDLERFQHL
ncbi:MAG: MGMT family protein [Vallitaleaceae bacterium]|nr:MGMT family protein [Vallitaleaceae bacterium]